VMLGPSYDVEMMNGYSYLVSDLGLKAGDKVGHIWQEGEYGQNGALGAKYAAGKLGLEYIDVPIKPTDVDLTTQVNDLLSKGVKAISMTSGPAQSKSVVTVLEQAKSPIPVMSSNPGFNTAIMDDATKGALEKHFYLIAAAAPYTADLPAVKKLVTQFEAEYKDVAKGFPVNFGYSQAALFGEALQKACDSGDMTRDGLHAAFGSIKSFDTGGLMGGILDYSKPGGITSRENYIAKADSTLPGSLKVVKASVTSDFAKAYTPA
jgi:ABC-type branched-subunit amino acid transport system substrate-binding protein